MFRQLRRYPPQIWLLFWGTLTGSLGLSLVWPFLTIYIRERLDVPLTTVTSLFTLQAAAGLVATMLISPLLDRFGRRWPMIGGLVASGITLAFMSRADTLAQWVILLPAYGIVNTVFRIGSYSMVADMIPTDERARVYALLRMGDNVGISFGPAIGGLLASVGYQLSYYFAALTQFGLAVFVLLMIRETMAADHPSPNGVIVAPSSGYGALLRDRVFLIIWGLYILVQIAASMVFILLGLYMKENYSIPEGQYGLIVGTNAVIVVLFQYIITRFTSQRRPLPVIASGALIYAVGMIVFALSGNFWAFLLGMMVFTGGEMLLVPTATALVSAIAPAHMRARYMGIFTLSFRVGSGVGPVVGGWLSDQFAPVATWYGGMIVCLIAATGYALLPRLHAVRAVPAIKMAAKAELK